MSQTYEDYERDYTTLTFRVRSFLASSSCRSSWSSLTECQRLLDDARTAIIAMEGLAEINGNVLQIEQARQRRQRELSPLRQQVDVALNNVKNNGKGNKNNTYQAPTTTDIEYGNNNNDNIIADDDDTTQRLITSSEELLYESQALCASSEQIGNETLNQMERQREQLDTTNRYLYETQVLATRARYVLQTMRNKVLRNKIVLYTLIGLLIVANGWAFHQLFTKNKKQE